ncbi:ankyrin repeat and MYND domain-containing protein 2-like [Mytilus californianus]|uniref:ankyrin repeat and MYND domain-containing protein 2-like n=1 Tax=Mytilus californianus TaxID=6549 RepID=UPI0022465E0E|nr:ankyrin repeat and MYND domain-containing protein 2-like [Mytilus californianus]
MAADEKKMPSEAEKKFIDAIVGGKLEEVQTLLKEPTIKIDFTDDTGTTPLQHAAFRGKTDICQLLLANGADVNSRYHDNGYTALMFAALSGNAETTRLLLEAGARTDYTNSVGRTATQMAAFVGQHECVSVINNYFSKDDLTPYIKIQGVDTEPRLPQELASPLAKMINFPNLHPVKLAFYLQENSGLLENSTKKVVRTLESLCEKCMKARETNHVMAMKTHYFSFVVAEAGKVYKEKGSLDEWIKQLIKGRQSDGFSVTQENLIRESIKQFLYSDCPLFHQCVRSLAPVKIGDDPTALNVLSQVINGQRFFNDDKTCTTCGEIKAEKKCSACKMVNYCNQTCQKLHWSTHKKFCKSLAEQYIRIEEMKKKEEELKQKEEELKKHAEDIEKRKGEIETLVEQKEEIEKQIAEQ